jgi:hypothetical protein
MASQMKDSVASRPTKRAVIGDRPDLDRAWEEDELIRMIKMMRLID